MAKRSAMPVDVTVGQNIRIARLQRGLSQTMLGEKIGVTFQQVQKYEKGSNRVGASRIQQISHVLHIPIADLFQGAETATRHDGPEQSARTLMVKPHSLRMLTAFDQINNDGARLALLHLAESLIGQAAAPKPKAGRTTHRGRPAD